MEYGVGEVVGILKLYDGIEDYIEVGDSNIKIGVDINLSFIINTKARLFGRLDLKPAEKTIFTKCIDSLILGIGHVFKVNQGQARGVVSNYIKFA